MLRICSSFRILNISEAINPSHTITNFSTFSHFSLNSSSVFTSIFFCPLPGKDSTKTTRFNSFYNRLNKQNNLIKISMSSTSHSGDNRHVNRLGGEESPYLLQHAHNPVDWYPWGEEAFAKAVAENKPIFLSVGYSTCHWCHVMEKESFENEEVAKLMNEWFVNIKVDREERPDVDKVYMTYVQATQGGGGWPMSVFLTPTLKPVLGGTYFPPEDKFGRIGFKSLLRRVKEVWDAREKELEEGGEDAIIQLKEASRATASSRKVESTLAEAAVELCTKHLASRYDSKLGGFGRAPKFPRPSEINVLFRRYYQLLEKQKKDVGTLTPSSSSLSSSSSSTSSSGNREAQNVLKMATHTLESMTRGGVHDHLGGGFHRYSVDDYWHVPHFEKMLYDQAQLANAYLDAYIITGNTRFSATARDILDYLRRDMTHPAGGIFSAEDADSMPKEGGRAKEGLFYIWSYQEIKDVLGSQNAQAFCAHYYVKAEGNCDLSPQSDPHHEFVGLNVLIERNSLTQTAAKLGMQEEEIAKLLGKCRADLFAFRSNRPRPHLDDKIIVAWNGLIISAFSRAYRILKSEPKYLNYQFPVDGCDSFQYLQSAINAASFIHANLYDENTKNLKRSFRKKSSQVDAFADDYAFLIAGLLDIYEINGDVKWLDWALELQSTQDELFLDKEGGGYFNTQKEDQSSILVRMKEDYDGAEPSANSISCSNLIRFSSLLSGDASAAFLQTAEHALAVFADRIRTMAMAVPQMCCSFDSLSYPSKCQILICGNKSLPETQQLVYAAFSVYSPHRIVLQIDPENDEDVKFWQKHNPNFLVMAQKNRTKPCALVCRDFTCLSPVFYPSELKSSLLNYSRPIAKQINFNINI